MKTQKKYLEKTNRIMKFVANFLKTVYYMLKLLNFEP